jgi:hypothetical protein
MNANSFGEPGQDMRRRNGKALVILVAIIKNTRRECGFAASASIWRSAGCNLQHAKRRMGCKPIIHRQSVSLQRYERGTVP